MRYLLSLIIMFCLGCASIVSEKTYPVAFNSNPSGANLEIKDRSGSIVYSGKTPTTVNLNAGAGYFKKGKYSCNYSLAGYQDQIQQVNASLDGWYWGNILLGGLIGGVIVDPITGAMFEIEQENVHVNMSKK